MKSLGHRLKRFLRARWHEYSALPQNFVNCHFTRLCMGLRNKPEIVFAECRVPVKQLMVKKVRDYRAEGST